MGGFGSGSSRRLYSKKTADRSKNLDVNWLNRNGYLIPGRRSYVGWLRNGKDAGSLDLRAEVDYIVLEYRLRLGFAEWESISQCVLLSRTECNYGGRRSWFICPGAHCGRRVGKLYADGNYFLCRHCYNLAYISQRETASGRMLMKAQSIRRRLNGSSNMTESFPAKPKGMHWHTYLNLRRKYDDADKCARHSIAMWLEKLENRHCQWF